MKECQNTEYLEISKTTQIDTILTVPQIEYRVHHQRLRHLGKISTQYHHNSMCCIYLYIVDTSEIPLIPAQTERLWSPIRLEKICYFEQIIDIMYIVSKILLKRDRKRKMILINLYIGYNLA